MSEQTPYNLPESPPPVNLLHEGETMHMLAARAVVANAAAVHYEHAADRLQAVRDDNIASFRDAMTDVTDNGRKLVDQYLIKNAPNYLVEVYLNSSGYDDPDKKRVTWTEWLGQEATNEQVLNIMQWHTDDLEKQQNDPEAQELIASKRVEYKRKLKKGIREGWLHEDAAGAEELVDKVKVFAGDIFEQTISRNSAYAGELSDGTAAIVIAPSISDSAEQRQADFKAKLDVYYDHEENHAVLGSLPYRWLNEAVTEHVALVMENGQLQSLNPNSREGRMGTYQAERMLLALILTGGNKNIPVQMATRAYSDPAMSKGEFKQFTEAVDESWGAKGVLKKIQGMIMRREAEYRKGSNEPVRDIRKKASIAVLEDMLGAQDYVRASEMTSSH